MKKRAVALHAETFLEQTVVALPEKAICISSNEQNPSVVPCLVIWHSGVHKLGMGRGKKKKTSRKICKWKDHLGSPICNLKGRKQKQILLVTKRRDILSCLSFFPKNLKDL